MRDSHGSLDAFAGGDDITTDVRAVFSWSYKALSAPAARLFRLLGLHCGPDVSVPAVAALAGLPPRGTRGLLGEPTRAHLLTEHFPGRCTLHDWSQGTTLSHLGDSYQRLGRFDEAAGCLEQALAVLRAHDNRWAEGITLGILGTVHRRLHRHDEAVEHYHRALRTHRDIGNRWGRATPRATSGTPSSVPGSPRRRAAVGRRRRRSSRSATTRTPRRSASAPPDWTESAPSGTRLLRSGPGRGAGGKQRPGTRTTGGGRGRSNSRAEASRGRPARPPPPRYFLIGDGVGVFFPSV